MTFDNDFEDLDTHTWTEYQDFVQEGISELVPEADSLVWSLLGLGAEVGECQEVVEKAIRKKGYVEITDERKLFEELGDVLWYLCATCVQLGFSLEDVMEHNVKKLLERKYNSETSTAEDA